MRALTSSGRDLGSNITVAASIWSRIKGLLGRNKLEAGEGLLIQPCKGIHTYFMKFAIDALFLDKENRIVMIYRNLPPNRLTPIFLKAHSVLELPAGTITTEISPGDVITFS